MSLISHILFFFHGGGVERILGQIYDDRSRRLNVSLKMGKNHSDDGAQSEAQMMLAKPVGLAFFELL